MIRATSMSLAATLTLWISHGAAQNTSPILTTLYRFSPSGDGSAPQDVVFGNDGVLYGTTAYGGTGSISAGTVYSLTPPASPGGRWIESLLYSFAGGSDGAVPSEGVTIGADGVLYGATSQGGNSNCMFDSGCGTVYSLAPPASPGGTWAETVLYRFTGGSDGAHPVYGLFMGSGGVLYGVTTSDTYVSTVFALSPPPSPGGTWSLATLYEFTQYWFPLGGVIPGTGEVLYGVVNPDSETGSSADMILYSLTPPPTTADAWTYSPVCTNFPAQGKVAIGREGAIYAASRFGGAGHNGMVFRATAPAQPGGSCGLTILHSFPPHSTGGGQPDNGIAMGPGGVLYGALGQYRHFAGSLYAVLPPASGGGVWSYKTLYTFGTPASAGQDPSSAPVIRNGILYGTTLDGGKANSGTVYSLTP
jgi:uncharacterized repeat protein (TIGR03803 family)